MEWADAKLHYCQATYGARDYDSDCASTCSRTSNSAWNPYRSDCSGLVSWAWEIPAPGYVTGDFAPFSTSVSHTIDCVDLAPGDAVNLNSNEHIMLFKQWINHGSVAEFVQEPGCAYNPPVAQVSTIDVSCNGNSISLSGWGEFYAIRKN